jgi:hypothetical protein
LETPIVFVSAASGGVFFEIYKLFFQIRVQHYDFFLQFFHIQQPTASIKVNNPSFSFISDGASLITGGSFMVISSDSIASGGSLVRAIEFDNGKS